MKPALLLALALATIATPVAAGQQSEPIRTWRASFLAATDREGSDAFLQTMRGYETTEPVAGAFLATAELVAIGYKRLPFLQFRSFRRWTSRLDEFVAASDGHPDTHLLRLGVSASAPGFLGYRDGVEQDCSVVALALDGEQWRDEPDLRDVAGRLLEKDGLCQ